MRVVVSLNFQHELGTNRCPCQLSLTRGEDSWESAIKEVTNGVADHAGNDPVTGAEAGATHQETSDGGRGPCRP